MATTRTDPTNINRAALLLVYAASVEAIRNNAKLSEKQKSCWRTAASKAIDDLLENPRWWFEGGVFTVLSRKSGKTYKVDQHCSCAAGQNRQKCYHLVSRRLIELYLATERISEPPAEVETETQNEPNAERIAANVLSLTHAYDKASNEPPQPAALIPLLQGAQPKESSEHVCLICLLPLKSSKLEVHTACAMLKAHTDELVALAQEVKSERETAVMIAPSLMQRGEKFGRFDI